MENVVRGIIDGSEVLNRMRTEVSLVVTTLLSLVGKEDAGQFYETHKPNSHESYPDCGTRVWGKSPTTNEEFHWLILYRGRFERLEVSLFHKKDEQRISYEHLGLRDVQLAHSALPRFVEGMLELFPALEERWQPLMDAAAKPVNAVGIEYEVVFKRTVGFHAETFGASSDDQARLFVKAFQDRGKRAGENFYYPISLRKTVPLRP